MHRTAALLVAAAALGSCRHAVPRDASLRLHLRATHKERLPFRQPATCRLMLARGFEKPGCCGDSLSSDTWPRDEEADHASSSIFKRPATRAEARRAAVTRSTGGSGAAGCWGWSPQRPPWPANAGPARPPSAAACSRPARTAPRRGLPPPPQETRVAAHTQGAELSRCAWRRCDERERTHRDRAANERPAALRAWVGGWVLIAVWLAVRVAALAL